MTVTTCVRWLLMHEALPVVPPKLNRKEPTGCDYAYKDCNRIERTFTGSSNSDESLRATARLPSHSSDLCLAARQALAAILRQ